MFYFKDEYYFNKILVANTSELEYYFRLFQTFNKKVAQAHCSELLDLNQYTTTRNVMIIRSRIRSFHQQPFEFICCLN